MIKREKSSALKSMMSRSPGGLKFSSGRKAMRDRHSAEADAAAQHAINQFAGTVETMFLAAASDGRVSREEVDHMADIVFEVTDGDLTRSDVLDMIQSYAAAVARDGYEGRLETLAEALDDDTKRSAFILAAAVAMGDGEFGEDEEELFYDLAEVYDISDDEAEDLLEGVAEGLSD